MGMRVKSNVVRVSAVGEASRFASSEEAKAGTLRLRDDNTNS